MRLYMLTYDFTSLGSPQFSMQVILNNNVIFLRSVLVTHNITVVQEHGAFWGCNSKNVKKAWISVVQNHIMGMI